MDLFLILQLLFDAVFMFGVLFLFHYSVQHAKKKNEESDILKNAQVLEIRENLQELLLTLKQLGKEVSDNIQEKVKEAEEKTEEFKRLLSDLQIDLSKTLVLAEEVSAEKKRLEEKAEIMRSARNSQPVTPLISPTELKMNEVSEQPLKKPSKSKKTSHLGIQGQTVGFSSGVVKEVYRLADDNRDLNEITHLTQLSRAEVQLILNLRVNRFTTPN